MSDSEYESQAMSFDGDGVLDDVGSDAVRTNKENDDWSRLNGFKLKIQYIMELLATKKRVWVDLDDPDGPDDPDSSNLQLQSFMVEWLEQPGDPDPQNPTALHWFANTPSSQNMPDQGTLKNIVQWIIEKNPEALSKGDNKNGYPLHLAIESRHYHFIDWVMDYYLPEEDAEEEQEEEEGGSERHNLDFYLRLSGFNGQNCIHAALVSYPEIVLKLIDVASPQTLCQQDKDGNTPLHYAMDYKLCSDLGERKYIVGGGKPDKDSHLSVVKALVKKADVEMQRKHEGRDIQFNSAKQSPLNYFDHTMAEQEKRHEEEAQKKAEKLRQANLTRPGRMRKKRDTKKDRNPKNAGTKEGSSDQKRERAKGENEDAAGRDEKQWKDSGKDPRDTRLAKEGAKGLKSSKDRIDGRYDGKRSGLRRAGTFADHDDENDDVSRSEAPSKSKSSGPRDQLRGFGKQRGALGLTIQTGAAALDGNGTGPSSPAAPMSARPNMSAPRHHGFDHKSLPSVQEKKHADSEHVVDRDGNEKHTHRDKGHEERAVDPEEERNKKEEQQKVKKERRIKKAGVVKDWLKIHYLLNRSDLEARKLLYGPTDLTDKNLFFDATWYRKKSGKEIARIVQDLALIGGFDTTLSYVTLPTVFHQEKSRAEIFAELERDKNGVLIKAPKENPWLGRDGAVRVLRTLADKGVERILRLTVHDMEAPSHTDESIEKALTGSDMTNIDLKAAKAIHVDTLDWRRLDVPSDVLYHAARNVRVLYLYWSGNASVLKDWSSSDGLGRLLKLKEIHVTVYPGTESRRRTEKLIQDFEEKFKKRHGLTVECIQEYEPPTWSGTATQETSAGAQQDDSKEEDHWIKTMESFRVQFVNAMKAYSRPPNPNYASVRPIKVALIDDGVDLGELETYGAGVKVTGMSFFPSNRGANYNCNVPWYTSSGGHGTAMANMIFKINPYVQLHVMKLHDGTVKGNRTIHASSAAQAVSAAVRQKVNIISMSWTIKTSVHENEQGIQELKDALQEAKNANILMFCSASDDRTESAYTLPYSHVGADAIFRIGAADVFGQRDRSVNDSNRIKYYFPGNNVAESSRPRSSKPIKYHDGSSVSTALAAGLAALILHMAAVNAVEVNADPKKSKLEKQKATFCDQKLQLHYYMNMVFDAMDDKGDSDNKKYLQVWNWFKKYAEDLRNATGPKKVALICDLISSLTVRVQVEMKN